MSRKQSMGIAPRTQSVSDPPTMELVKVAVLPPRLPADMAPPTGVGAADVFSWDESVNWIHNEKLDEEKKVSSTKNFMRKAGLTTKREKANADTPPFVFRQVPYDTWRKHYAKDKEGRYRGTLAPAEDCLLLPEDVERWRAEAPVTKADMWTRGKDALPVYHQAQEEAASLPQYSESYEGPPSEEMRLASVSTYSSNEGSSAAKTSSFSADGKSTEQIIQEAKDRAEAKKKEPKSKGWRNSVKRGTEWALMGS